MDIGLRIITLGWVLALSVVNCGTCSGSQNLGLTTTSLQYSYKFMASATFYLTQIEVCTDFSCYFHFGKATIDSNPYVFMRKVDSSNVEIWTKFYNGSPCFYGFSIDNVQSNIYILLITGSNLYVLNADARRNGDLLNSFAQIGNMYSSNYYLSITISSDDSTLYISGLDVSFQGNICKASTTVIGTMICYAIENTFVLEPFVLIQTNQIYLSTYNSGFNKQLFMKLNLDTPSIFWQNEFVCGSGCTNGYSRSAINYDSTFVFTLFTLNTTTYLISFYSTNGAVYGNKYASSNIGYSSRIIYLNSDILYIGYLSSPNYYLVTLNLTNSILKTYQIASGIILYDMKFLSASNQLIFAGSASSFTKMYILISPESILSSSSDVTDVSPVLSTSSISVTSSSVGSISFPITYSTSIYSPTYASFLIVGGTQIISDVVYHLDDINIGTLNSSSRYEISEQLTCSLSGSTVIEYSYSSDKGNPIPSWASIDSTNFKLIFDTPTVTAYTSYTFTLAVYTSLDLTLYYSTVYVNVNPASSTCNVTNCNKCDESNLNNCSICNSGYQISSTTQRKECVLIPNNSSDSTSNTSTYTTIEDQLELKIKFILFIFIV